MVSLWIVWDKHLWNLHLWLTFILSSQNVNLYFVWMLIITFTKYHLKNTEFRCNMASMIRIYIYTSTYILTDKRWVWILIFIIKIIRHVLFTIVIILKTMNLEHWSLFLWTVHTLCKYCFCLNIYWKIWFFCDKRISQ